MFAEEVFRGGLFYTKCSCVVQHSPFTDLKYRGHIIVAEGCGIYMRSESFTYRLKFSESSPWMTFATSIPPRMRTISFSEGSHDESRVWRRRAPKRCWGKASGGREGAKSSVRALTPEFVLSKRQTAVTRVTREFSSYRHKSANRRDP